MPDRQPISWRKKLIIGRGNQKKQSGKPVYTEATTPGTWRACCAVGGRWYCYRSTIAASVDYLKRASIIIATPVCAQNVYDDLINQVDYVVVLRYQRIF